MFSFQGDWTVVVGVEIREEKWCGQDEQHGMLIKRSTHCQH